MPDVFITLEEAAAFEGITYEAMKKRVQRSPEQHNVKSQAREGGGKDQALISTSSLSAKARKAWRAAQKVEGSEVIIDKRAQEAVPWYVTADLNQYTEANKKRFYEAVELAARVQDFIDYDGPDRTGYAERYALGLGISPQSLYRYMKNVLEANAWALKLEKEDGKSRDYFRALALCRKPKETGTFPSLTDEQKAIIENIWFDKRFAANLGTIEIIALAKDTQTGYLYVVIADIAKRKPDQIIEDALDASRRLQREYKRPYYKFGVETVQFQYYFAEIMRQRAAAVGEYLPIEEINSTQNKDARIQSLQPFVKNGYIKFSKKHKTLLKQMTEYPMGKNDDAPDGLQMAVKLALDVKIGRRVDYRSVIARALDFRRGAY